uniref:Uncharacterized protein n=1 Tax=Manihot esculenta TaxID=3983 RepID=A0A2C9VKI2_MANES
MHNKHLNNDQLTPITAADKVRKKVLYFKWQSCFSFLLSFFVSTFHFYLAVCIRRFAIHISKAKRFINHHQNPITVIDIW